MNKTRIRKLENCEWCISIWHNGKLLGKEMNKGKASMSKFNLPNEHLYPKLVYNSKDKK